MERASLSSGAAAVLPLSVAAAAFRGLEDGARAAEAGSRLIRIRFSHTLEQLFEELLGDFFSLTGPDESVRSFRLVLSEADDAGPKALRAGGTGDLIRYARRFVDRAESGHWDHLSRWSSRAVSLVSSPEARAGLFLFEAWLNYRAGNSSKAAGEIEAALRALKAARPSPFSAEWEGLLHYDAGLLFTLPHNASMAELQKATLHFRDALFAWERAGSLPEPARERLAETYRRLARDHTEGFPALREHYENQAFQALTGLEPQLPRAQVVKRKGAGSRWLPRFWK